MEICCISDLHGYFPDVGSGDLLIICGDLTARDTRFEYTLFNDWLMKQNYPKKIIVAGNHDGFLEKEQPSRRYFSVGCYLQDSMEEFEGLKIYGSPWTKTFPGMNPHCKAFTCDTEEELAEKWALIPEDTDILITHGPAFTVKDGKNPDHNLGSTSLLKRIGKPSNHPIKLHLFGHIHEGYGTQDMRWFKTKNGFKGGIHVNASHVNERYEPVNKPIRVIL